MFDIMFPRLKAWENSDKVDLVLLKGRGRALSAGADLKFVAGAIQNLSRKYELDYFIDTLHDLMHFIGTMQTPLVSFMNGITVGTGCSISAFSHFSIATEHTRMGMPETRFGHFCDTGSSFYLSRLNGQLGKYIALCGKTLVAEDALFSGLATHFVPANRLDCLEDKLVNLYKPTQDTINTTIEQFSVKPGHKPFSNTLHGPNRRIIEQCFKFNTVNEITRALEKEGSRFSLEAIDQINKGSPVAVALTLEHLNKASKMTLSECLRMEHIGWQSSAYQPDFYNGIISTVFKKQEAKWTISDPYEVDVERDIEIQYIYANAKRKLDLFSKERDCYSTTQCREYGLPSETEVALAKQCYDIKTDQDLISWFVNNRNNKYGVRQEVGEIIRSSPKRIDLLCNKHHDAISSTFTTQ
ncbi:ClpP/crotonase-like domain-containing protein [Helicostylum pulchrum]|nr:ClpP/crotonase-like domain-containing protein [Helicostylum pulchrum]